MRAKTITHTLVVALLLIVSSCAVAQSEWQLRESDTSPTEAMPLKAESILRINKALRDDPKFDLTRVERLIPKMFVGKNSKRNYFSPEYSLVFLEMENGVIDNGVYKGDIIRLGKGLSAHAESALERGELERARLATQLIVELMRQPMLLEPPTTVTIGQGTAEEKTVPGSDFYYNALVPAFRLRLEVEKMLGKFSKKLPPLEDQVEDCLLVNSNIKSRFRQGAVEYQQSRKSEVESAIDETIIWKKTIRDATPLIDKLSNCIKNLNLKTEA